MAGLEFTVVLRDLWRFVTRPRQLLFAVLLILGPQLTYFLVSADLVGRVSDRMRELHIDKHSRFTVLGFSGSVYVDEEVQLSAFDERASSRFFRLSKSEDRRPDLTTDAGIVSEVIAIPVLAVLSKLLYYAFGAYMMVLIFGAIRGEHWPDRELWRLTLRHNMWTYLLYSFVLLIVVALILLPAREILLPIARRVFWVILPIMFVGLYLMLRLTLWAPALIIEEDGLISAIKRSFTLTRGSVLMILLLSITVMFGPTVMELGAILIDDKSTISTEMNSIFMSLGVSARAPVGANGLLIALQLVGAFLFSYLAIPLDAIIYTHLRNADEQQSEPEPLSETERLTLANFAARQ